MTLNVLVWLSEIGLLKNDESGNNTINFDEIRLTKAENIMFRRYRVREVLGAACRYI